MRKILMSKPGEFEVHAKKDFFRSVAVKMVAAMIQNSSQHQLQEKSVLVSNDLNDGSLGREHGGAQSLSREISNE